MVYLELLIFACLFFFGGGISLFKMAPNLGAEVLSSVPEYQKVVMCRVEKTRVR